MSVAVLVYHATTADGRYGHFDVPIDTFEEQIDRLIDTGVEFVRFAQANDPALIASSKRHVAVTFDDGHRSNLRAWEFLHRRGIHPAAFIVSDWAKSGRGEHDDDYAMAFSLREFSGICDFGCHGATHGSLADLCPDRLDRELAESKDYLEQVLGRAVADMSIPLGASNAAVIAAARAHGFENIGNSLFDLNRAASSGINRLTISADRSVSYPSRLVAHGELYWRARKLAKFVKRRLIGPSGLRVPTTVDLPDPASLAARQA